MFMHYSPYFRPDDPPAGGDPPSGDPPRNPEIPPTDGDPGKRTFTQAELDALFAQRAEQAKRSAVSDLLKELGVEDSEKAKSLLKAAQDAEDAKKSEAEKAAARIADLEKRAQDEKTAREAAEAKARETLLRSAVLIAAAAFNDPADAWVYVDRSKISIDDAGEVKGVKEAIEAVAKAKPYLLKGENGRPPGTPPKPPRQPGKQDEKPQAPRIRL